LDNNWICPWNLVLQGIFIMETMYKFMLWFVVSLVLTFFVYTIAPNQFLFSFIIALAISFIGVKDD